MMLKEKSKAGPNRTESSHEEQGPVSLVFEEGLHCGGLGERMTEEQPLPCNY